MRKIFLKYGISCVLVCIVFSSCNKEQVDIQQDQAKIVTTNYGINDISMSHGMLVFKSNAHLNTTINTLNTQNGSLADLESRFGIQTLASLFHEVVLAEDRISEYYLGLPEKEQSYWRMQPQIHSKEYKEAIEIGLIKEIQQNDGNVYFDYNLADKSLAPVLTLNGFVKVDSVIINYANNAIKLIKNGDFSKMDQLESFDEEYEDDCFIVKIAPPSDSRLKHLMTYDWEQKGGWKYPESRRRVIVWLDGHSEPYGSYTTGCAQYMQCTNTIRAEAQKKNFWGNWVYGSYFPNLSLTMPYSYRYVNYSCDPYITYGCGVYSCEHVNDIGSDSPYSYSGTVNNAFLNLIPTGIYSGTYWFHSAFWCNGTLSATLDGETFYYSW